MAWPKFKTQDEVPEGFKDEYHEVDGEWVAKEAEQLGDGGKSAIAKERAARKKAEAAAQEAQAALDQATLEAEAKGVGLTDKDLEEIREKARVAAESKYANHADLIAENRGLKLDSKVKALALTNGVSKDAVEDWWTLNASAFDLTDDGTPILRGDPTADIGKHIAGDMKKARPRLYDGTQADGGGARGINDPSGKGGGSLSFEDVMANPSRALGAQEA